MSDGNKLWSVWLDEDTRFCVVAKDHESAVHEADKVKYSLWFQYGVYVDVKRVEEY